MCAATSDCECYAYQQLFPLKFWPPPNWHSLTGQAPSGLLMVLYLLAPNYEGLDTPLNYAVTHPLSKISGYATAALIVHSCMLIRKILMMKLKM